MFILALEDLIRLMHLLLFGEVNAIGVEQSNDNHKK